MVAHTAGVRKHCGVIPTFGLVAVVLMDYSLYRALAGLRYGYIPPRGRQGRGEAVRKPQGYPGYVCVVGVSSGTATGQPRVGAQGVPGLPRSHRKPSEAFGEVRGCLHTNLGMGTP